MRMRQVNGTNSRIPATWRSRAGPLDDRGGQTRALQLRSAPHAMTRIAGVM